MKTNIVYQKNKETGIVYAYENNPYWDKEKKQSRSKRKCIGKVDPVTGEIVPTDGRSKKPSYKKLYEELQGKYEDLESLVAALKDENKNLKQRDNT